MTTPRGHAAALALTIALAGAPAAFAQPAAGESHAAGMAHYEDGRYAEALTEFTKAAHAGDVRAQEIAGMMNLLGPRLYGEAVCEDRVAAQRWLRRAAGNGSEVAAVVARRIAAPPAAVAMERR